MSMYQASNDQSSKSLHVVAPHTSTLYIIAKDDIHQLPIGNSKRLVLCPQFNTSDPLTSCPFGSNCRRVHATTTRALKQSIHINRAWKNREECIYPLLNPGQPLNIKDPKGPRVETIDSGDALCTQCVFGDPIHPTIHCAHFYYSRECHLGALCDFAHVIRYVKGGRDEKAKKSAEQPPKEETQQKKEPVRQVEVSGRPVRSTSVQSPAPGKCYRCGERGHLASVCPSGAKIVLSFPQLSPVKLQPLLPMVLPLPQQPLQLWRPNELSVSNGSVHTLQSSDMHHLLEVQSASTASICTITCDSPPPPPGPPPPPMAGSVGFMSSRVKEKGAKNAFL